MQQRTSNHWVMKRLFSFLLFFGLIGQGAEAAVTLSWSPTTTNEDGSLCTDLAGYKIYYDTDGAGIPYNGTGINEGDSPIGVPLGSLSDTTNPQIALTGLTSGATYSIAVTAYDTNNNESAFSNMIEATEIPPLGNDPPIATIGASPTGGIAPLTVSFNGTGTDTDGTVSDYTWSMGDGSSTNTQNPSNTYLNPGSYTVTLTVTDDQGATGSATTTIQVSAPPADTTAPSIDITTPTASSAYFTSNGSISLSGTASDNDQLSRIVWTNDRGGSGTATGAAQWTASGILLRSGINLIAVTATDASGNSAEDLISINYTLPEGTFEVVFGEGADADYAGFCLDTYLNAGSPATNYVSSTTGLNSYTWPVNTDANHILFRCDFSSLPTNALVSEAYLSLYLFESGGEPSYTLPVYKITQGGVDITRATWSTYDGFNIWSGGAGGLGAIAPTEDTPIIDTTQGYKTWKVTKMAQDWFADPMVNQGLMITSDTTASSGSHRYFHSGEYSDSAKRPKLLIRYTLQKPANNAPTANAGPDQAVTQSQLSGGSVQITLDGSASTDPDGDLLQYRWTQTGGNPVTLMGDSTASPFFSATSALSGQTLTFQLVTQDGTADSVPDTVRVTIEALPAANEPPLAGISGTPKEGSAPLTVQLSGSGTDTDGTITSYLWNFGDGTTFTGKETTHTYSTAGTYTAKLSVTDDGGATTSAMITITVAEAPAANVLPTAGMTASVTTGPAPLMINFVATASDPDGTIVAYLWDFGDGSNSTGNNPSHTFLKEGSYSINLKVTDDRGGTASCALTLQVTTPLAQIDSDGDGLNNQEEIDNGLNPEATDSDGDGISDFIEWGAATSPLDSDGDGMIDALDPDSDNDGLSDQVEGTDDADGDGALNYIDNNDEDGPLGDQDGDGINNSMEVTYQMNPNQSDSDGDEIDDGTEFGPNEFPLDTDGDETIDALDSDSDNDGTPDLQEGVQDRDGDGAANYVDSDDNDGPLGDQDQDGFTNRQETLAGLNPNLADSDQDGISDSEEAGDITTPTDTDGDGIVDALDIDSDNDGIPDDQESSEDLDQNGLSDRLDATMATFQTKLGHKMALKILTKQYRLSETKYLRNAISTTRWKPSKVFKNGGIQFIVKDLPIGEPITVRIIRDLRFDSQTQYWKFDSEIGYYKLAPTVSGKTLTFTLTDGGTGDADHEANGIIVDPGFIDEPGEVTNGGIPAETIGSSGGGGGGCALQQNPTGLPDDGLLIVIPLLLLYLLKKMRKI